ncbi:uncharacterized protein AC631_05393 [Debaryomyces fabryi]|uniref:Uncharacterized protein n=1 Tax=Debaryomyces fabryi TaxID=58627 RepID=A0A0V1PRH5_9ASCO|nr:uncharacterized protein AC631_05393 [Debaryomyces fabryi]KRZ98844.1 hypothetical protein AC631_05393 [Debaryomyces fabryi]CUM48634.1 unnamed protein product [Debaryomyces fabryi]
MSGSLPMSSLSNAKRNEMPSCDVNATIFPTSDIGRSDQVVTPTSLEQEHSCSSSSSLRNSLSKIIDETPLKRIKKRSCENTHEESPAANSIEQNETDEMETLSGISKYLKRRNIFIEEESIKGYQELEDVKISAQAQIDKLKSLNTFQQIDNFDWSKIEEAYAFIFNDYINQMEITIRDLDQSMKVTIDFLN